MFEPSSFSIILRRDLTQREQELVNRYWEFEKNNLSKFKYTLSSLNVEYQDLKLKKHSSISKTVSELAYLSTPDCNCYQCDQSIQFKTRDDVKHLANTDRILKNIDIYKNRTCFSCDEKNLKLKIDESIQSIIRLVHKLESLPKNIQDDLESLSYSEQLYLSIYSKYANSSAQVQIDKCIISEEYDLQITNALIEKRYLIDFTTQNSLINDLIELEAFIHVNHDYLTNELRNEVESYLIRIPKLGVYINTEFNSELKVELINYIKCINKLSYQQLKDIELIVKKVLLKQAENIIQIYASYYKVYANYDEAFRHIMEIATWNYSMRMVCNLIFYETRNMAANIQARRITGPSKKHCLRRSIESRLNNLKENPETKKFYSDLPQRIEIPAVVDYVIKTFMNDELGWDGLSGQEIVAKWTSFQNVDEIN